MSHVHAFPMHSYFFSYILVIFELFWSFSDCLSLSLPLFLFTLVVSMAPKRKSAPSRNPLHSGTSSSSDPSPSNIRFHDKDGFLRELFPMGHSFWTPSHSSGLRQHRPFHCHSQLGMGVTVWRPGHLFSRVYPGLLLQHARDWSFSTSFLHSCLRYAHSCHTAACYGCASGS